MFTRIMVPLDGSDVAAQALPHAIALADEFGAELTLTSVIQPCLHDRGAIDIFDITSEPCRAAEVRAIIAAGDYLDGIAAPLKARGLSVEVELIRGDDVADAIVQAAATEPNTLIVVSAHGRTGFDRLRLGSTADGIVTDAPFSVVVVPSETAPAAIIGTTAMTALAR